MNDRWITLNCVNATREAWGAKRQRFVLQLEQHHAVGIGCQRILTWWTQHDYDKRQQWQWWTGHSPRRWHAKHSNRISECVHDWLKPKRRSKRATKDTITTQTHKLKQNTHEIRWQQIPNRQRKKNKKQRRHTKNKNRHTCTWQQSTNPESVDNRFGNTKNQMSLFKTKHKDKKNQQRGQRKNTVNHTVDSEQFCWNLLATDSNWTKELTPNGSAEICWWRIPT